MAKVKARRSFFGTDYGSVRRGDELEVSDITARALVARGLCDMLEATKDAPTPRNAMAPPPRHNDPAPASSAKPAPRSTPKKSPLRRK